MIVYAINERTARRIDYLREQVRVLKEALADATGKKRIDFAAEQRRRLALKGKALTPEERSTCCQIVRPATILAWFRQLAAQKYDSSKGSRPGRPRKQVGIQKLVVSLARENPGWGYTKIRDALRRLKIEIGRTTVANMLPESGIEPAPEHNRKRTWKHFLKSHWETLYACDFFSVEVLGMLGTAHSPNCNPHAERFVETIRSECLDHFVILGERHLRYLIRQFIEHCLRERYHQGIGGQIIKPETSPSNDNAMLGSIGCRSRLGGLQNYYHPKTA